MLCKLWKVVCGNIFLVKNKHLYILDDYRKFPIVQKADSLTADDLVKATNIVFTEFGLIQNIISDAGTNFTSEMFRQFAHR